MYALIHINISLHSKFEVPSFAHSKDWSELQSLKMGCQYVKSKEGRIAGL